MPYRQLPTPNYQLPTTGRLTAARTIGEATASHATLAFGSWRLSVGRLLLLSAIATTAIALYGSVLLGIVRQWFDDTNSAYGALVAATAVVVFRRTYPTLATLPTQPRNRGFVILAAGLLTYVIGTITGDVFLLRASMPVVLFAVIVTLWGFAHVRALLAPLALLTLAIPLPAVIVTHLTLPLQLVASRVAAGTLWLAHVPVVRDGNLLTLPNITLEVAEACNGMRSVVSLVSVAAVCAALIPLSATRTVLVMAAAVPIAIVGNGFRVAATGLLALSMGEGAVSGTVHELTGFVAFVAMCIATLALLRITHGRTVEWARLHR
jgi:exosortase